jgi:F-type H+-transporting ATPase subunit b
LRVQTAKWLTFLCLTLCLGYQGGQAAFAFSQTAAAPAASPASAHGQKEDSEDINQFRHAPAVQLFARVLGISTETAAQIFEIVNSAILIFTILFFLMKIVPKAIRNRTANIQKKLVEAREATETANQRLSAVEAKLAKIGEDIEAIRQQTDRDLVQDERRIKQALEDERQRIVQSAEQEIESAAAAARRELKRFAVELAVDNAAKRIQLSYDSDKALVERFGKELTSEFGKGGQN